MKFSKIEPINIGEPNRKRIPQHEFLQLLQARDGRAAGTGDFILDSEAGSGLTSSQGLDSAPEDCANMEPDGRRKCAPGLNK